MVSINMATHACLSHRWSLCRRAGKRYALARPNSYFKPLCEKKHYSWFHMSKICNAAWSSYTLGMFHIIKNKRTSWMIHEGVWIFKRWKHTVSEGDCGSHVLSVANAGICILMSVLHNNYRNYKAAIQRRSHGYFIFSTLHLCLLSSH
jgi:hypothetical protein